MITPDPEDITLDEAQALADVLVEAVPVLDPRGRRNAHRAAQGLERARQLRAEADEMEARGETEVFDLRSWRKGG